MIVAAMTEPFSVKCCSMPIFRPSSTGFASAGAPAGAAATGPVGCSSVACAGAVSGAFSASWLIPLPSSKLDLDVDARGKVELHQGVDRLLRGIVDVDEALVGADLELLAGVLVDERAADHRELFDARRQRHRTGNRRPGPLRGLHDLRRGLIDQLVVVRLQADPNALLGHGLAASLSTHVRCASARARGAHSRIFVATPAPTVLPPSRMAKRRPSSRAMGVMSVTSRLVLSPGMTISVPAGSLASPVTSVVRM